MAATLGEQGVIIDEPAERAVVRHPTDLLRLIIAVVATILGFFLATTLNNLSLLHAELADPMIHDVVYSGFLCAAKRFCITSARQ